MVNKKIYWIDFVQIFFFTSALSLFLIRSINIIIQVEICWLGYLDKARTQDQGLCQVVIHGQY